MKQHIENLLQIAIQQLQTSGELPIIPAFVQVDSTKDKRFGDYASNIALILAKTTQKKPRDIAGRILEILSASPYVEKIEIAGPGFINFFLSTQALNSVITQILIEKENYGRSSMGQNKKVIVEFLSSNPTGPLHVGHGRHAAFGTIVSNLLNAVGFQAYQEYYVNDAGRQMDILAVSIWLRYLELCGESIPFPANGYQGTYVIDIARSIYEQQDKLFCFPAKEVLEGLPLDESEGGDKEIYIDAVIERAKQLLGNHYQSLHEKGLKDILDDIKNDLSEFGVHYDNWFLESDLVKSGIVKQLLERLKQAGHTYERDGALWFRSMHFGDEKDRVLIRSNGQCTYFANDVAYHFGKFERGFDIAIDIFGADHHGYMLRMKAAMQALGINPERLIYVIAQFVTLYRGNQQIQMSTRGGHFVPLRELRHEVGNDAARFFYVMRRSEQHMDFDLELAKSETNENPVYYVQYAYARIASVFKQLGERDLSYNEANGLAHIDKLVASEERQLVSTLSHYSDVVVSAALHYEPYQLINYLRELASDFHAYYNACVFLVEDNGLRDARLTLLAATRQVLWNALCLLGIKAPEKM